MRGDYERFRLVEAARDNGREILEMLREIGPGENGYNNNGWQLTEAAFDRFLLKKTDQAAGTGLRKGEVPQTTWWLYRDDVPVGVGKLRHYLTEQLEHGGGNIGYCIRPSARGRGYGTVMLAKVLEKAWEREMEQVLLSCFDDNIPSRRIIEANGGVPLRSEGNKLFFLIRNPG